MEAAQSLKSPDDKLHIVLIYLYQACSELEFSAIEAKLVPCILYTSNRFSQSKTHHGFSEMKASAAAAAWASWLHLIFCAPSSLLIFLTGSC